jgi:hypothetical protein
MGSTKHNNKSMDTHTSEKLPSWALIVSVSGGLTFLVVLLIIAVFIPQPTTSQFFIFRVVLALAAAAFGATISGFMRINLPLWGKGLISAGGALGLFVLVFYVNPPILIHDESSKPEIVKQPLSGIILDKKNGEPLSGVLVSLPKFGLTDTTDTSGSFSFEVKAEKQGSVRIMAQKEGLRTHRQDVSLGNTSLTFQMEQGP